MRMWWCSDYQRENCKFGGGGHTKLILEDQTLCGPFLSDLPVKSRSIKYHSERDAEYSHVQGRQLQGEYQKYPGVSTWQVAINGQELLDIVPLG